MLIEEGDYEALRASIDQYQNFDNIQLAQVGQGISLLLKTVLIVTLCCADIEQPQSD